MPRRFFVSQLAAGDSQTLTGSEARHLKQVLRMEVGDSLVLFDGSGLEAEAEIAAFPPQDTTPPLSGSLAVELRILERRPARSELPFSLTIASAVPKGDRLKWMVEKLTELGVTRFIPLLTARSVVDPREGKLERLKQTVIEACKQSGRSSLMEITPLQKWGDFLTAHPAADALWIAHPYGDSPSLAQASVGPVTIAIGPEGGFTEGEVSSGVESGGRLLRLGNRILRMETAALAAATLFGIPQE